MKSISSISIVAHGMAAAAKKTSAAAIGARQRK